MKDETKVAIAQIIIAVMIPVIAIAFGVMLSMTII